MAMQINNDLVLLLVRFLFGVLFIYGDGWKKIKDIKSTIKMFSEMGFKPGVFWGTFIALLETVGAILLILGIYTHLFAALFGAMMITAIIWKKKIGKIWEAYELDVVILALALTIMSVGSGKYILVNFPYSFMTWTWAIIAIFVSIVIAFLPQIFGKPYQNWKA